jgi:perosamine synthetase
MSQPFIPYGTQHIDEDDVAAVVEALRSGWLTTGPAVSQFESDLESVVGAPVAVLSSGTAALHAAYDAADVGPGTELITTPLTFVATAAMAVHLGAKVVFVDVDDETLSIDPGLAAAAITERTRVVSPVDYAGHPADLEPLLTAIHAGGGLLVEDASHALGATYQEKPVGSIADMTIFSFHPVKAITTGEGGAVASLDERLLEKVKRFRNHGMVREPESHVIQGQGAWHQEVQHLGLNYRLPDPLAALGSSQLTKLKRFIEERTRLAERYSRILAGVDGVRLPIARPGVTHAWHLYPVRILGGRRRLVFDHLRAQGIGVQVHYLPVHRHPVFASMGYRQGTCPIAEAAYEELISLPLFPRMNEDDQGRIVEELLRALTS